MRLWSEHRGKLLGGLSALALVFVLAAGSVYAWIASPEFEQLLARNIARLIEERTGLDAELSDLDIEFQRQRILAGGLVLRGDEGPEDPPLASVEAIRIVVDWRALVSRRLVLSSLEVVNPRFRVEIGDNGETNMPSPPPVPGTTEPPSFEFEIGDFSIVGGELSFDEKRVAIDFRLADFAGTFDYTEVTRTLSGNIAYAGLVARESGPAIPYTLSANFAYSAGTALIESMDIRSDDTALGLEGRIERVFGDRSGFLDYGGRVDLGFLTHFFGRREFDGSADVTGTLAFTTTGFQTSGTMRSESLQVNDWRVENASFSYRYAYPERILEAAGLEADAFGGSVRGEIRLNHGTGAVRTELAIGFTNLDTLALRGFYPWGSAYLIHSRAGGAMTGWVDGAGSDFDVSGTATLGAVSAGESSTDAIHLPVSGSLLFGSRPGTIDLRSFDVVSGSTRAWGMGRFTPDSLDVQMSASSADLSDLAWVLPDANGSGRFDGEIRGPYPNPVVEGAFETADFDFLGARVSRASGSGRVEGNMATVETMDVRLGSGRLTATGTWSLPNRTGNLDILVERLVPRDLGPLFDLPIDGIVSGNVTLASAAPLVGSGYVRLDALAFEGRPLGDARLEWQYDGARVEVIDLRLEREDSLIVAAGTHTPGTGDLDVQLDVRDHPIEDLAWLGVPAEAGGLIETGRFGIEGNASAPLVSGTASIDGFRYGDQPLGDATVDVERRPRGFFLRLATDEGVSADVEIDSFAPGHPFSGSAAFIDFDAARLSQLESGTLVASGNAQFDGLLADLSTLSGRGEISAMTAFLENDTLVVNRPFTFVFDRAKIGVTSVDASSELVEILVDGTILLEEGFPLSLTVAGRVDLSLLESPDVPFATAGEVAWSGSVRGTIDAPDLSGVATLSDVSLTHPDVFVGLTQLNGNIFFDGDTINLNDLEGTAGGGSVTIRGNVAVDGFGPGPMDVRVDATDVRIRTVEGVRAVFDATTALRGEPRAPSLEGHIHVRSLAFAEGFEDFMTVFSASGAPRPPGPLDSLGLALHVEGDENIRVENGLVGVDVRLNLDVSGTAGEPALTGYVESTSGTLDLQGTRYRVTRGNVSFIDPVGIDPVVDLQAETEIRNYRVILTISGRASDPRLDMRSEPPLPQLEIVSLIAGGRTREELAEEAIGNRAVAPTSEELFQSASATILTDLLADRVGSRFGLLNRVRIDPFLVGAENDPAARITISERVTSNLEITYSQDLSSNRQQIIQIEYFLDDGTSFVASRDETGAAGLDVQFRKRFR